MITDETEEKQFIIDSLTIQDYYKNVLIEEYHAEFEQIVESISYDLKIFHTNLVYLEKILDFINTEFKTEGVFPQDLIFLNLFITNTVNSMILITHKLVLDKADLQNKKNSGLHYLKVLIEKKMVDDEKIKMEIHEKLKIVKPLFQEYKRLSDLGNINILRNSKIAHDDIGKHEEINALKVDIGTFVKIHKFASDIFEILSLQYFERKSTFNSKMIQHHTFKKFVCQNVMMNNPNPSAQLDIDAYFACLRRNFVNSLTK